jgi:hypothetical protein
MLSPSWLAGAILTCAFVLLLELGAIGAKVAGVWWLSYALLALTGIANYVAGADHWASANLAASPTLAAWRSSAAGAIAPVLYAAMVPVLLAVFLHLAVSRARQLLNDPRVRRPIEVQVVEVRRDVQALGDALTEVVQLLKQPPALPDQPHYNAPRRAGDSGMQAVEMPKMYACQYCGSTLTQGEYGAMTRYKRCKKCSPSFSDAE